MRFFKRRRLSASAREELYDRVLAEQIAAGLTTSNPLCNICGLPIIRGIRWHESHMPAPHAITGAPADGLAHPKCNIEHNHKVDTPWVAKSKRQRRRDIGATLSRSPLPGGREDYRKKTLRGEVINRKTGEPL
jgi:hypothetical protein